MEFMGEVHAADRNQSVISELVGLKPTGLDDVSNEVSIGRKDRRPQE